MTKEREDYLDDQYWLDYWRQDLEIEYEEALYRAT